MWVSGVDDDMVLEIVSNAKWTTRRKDLSARHASSSDSRHLQLFVQDWVRNLVREANHYAFHFLWHIPMGAP